MLQRGWNQQPVFECFRQIAPKNSYTCWACAAVCWKHINHKCQLGLSLLFVKFQEYSQISGIVWLSRSSLIIVDDHQAFYTKTKIVNPNTSWTKGPMNHRPVPCRSLVVSDPRTAGGTSLIYPVVSKHGCEQSPCFMGKLTTNGHFQ